jgi:hypothetical protein
MQQQQRQHAAAAAAEFRIPNKQHHARHVATAIHLSTTQAAVFLLSLACWLLRAVGGYAGKDKHMQACCNPNACGCMLNNQQQRHTYDE